jgi:hypothetical protein
MLETVLINGALITFNTVKIATEIAATMRPYSTAVPPPDLFLAIRFIVMLLRPKRGYLNSGPCRPDEAMDPTRRLLRIS